MLCDICTKNQATVHLTEIVDGQITELHLCEQCAKEKSAQMEQQFGLSDLLAGLVDFGKHMEEKDDLKLKCPNCKLTYKDFKKIGRLGCSYCYVTFRKYLDPLLKSIHGASQHLGKVPPGQLVKTKEQLEPKELEQTDELEVLKQKLQKAIAKEEFEEAAKLRDRIRELEAKERQKQGKNGIR